MKASELRKLTEQELKEKLLELKKRLMSLKFQNAVGSLSKTSEIRSTKRDIAKILTVLKEMEINKR